MKLYALITMVLSISLPTAHSEEFVRPTQWTVENLVGKSTSFQGASCYSATLIAKGYLNVVVFVGPRELNFYMGQFCIERQGEMQTGDVLTLSQSGRLDHVALYMGGEKVFEKESSDGKYEPFYPEFSPTFQLHPMSESRWFKNYIGDGRELKTYSCKDASVVHTTLAKCEDIAHKIGIVTVRLDLEKMMFAPSQNLTLSDRALSSMTSIKNAISEMPDTEPCLPYVGAAADSIVWALKNFRLKDFQKLSTYPQWSEANSELEKLLIERFGI